MRGASYCTLYKLGEKSLEQYKLMKTAKYKRAHQEILKELKVTAAKLIHFRLELSNVC
jgi:hypothetical protein